MEIGQHYPIIHNQGISGTVSSYIFGDFLRSHRTLFFGGGKSNEAIIDVW